MSVNEKMSFVLYQSSDTQRTVVRANDDTVLITKEWKKAAKDDWIMGKGIAFSRSDLIDLGKVLECKNDEQLAELLTNYELLQEDCIHDYQ